MVHPNHAQDDDDDDDDERQSPTTPIRIPTNESTPLLPPTTPVLLPSPQSDKWYTHLLLLPSCTANTHSMPNNPGHSDRFLSCSPMVSGLRTLRLPDLELRHALLEGAAPTRTLGRVASHVEEMEKGDNDGDFDWEIGRRRSKSLGDERERRFGMNGGGKRVASGLSLCLAEEEEEEEEEHPAIVENTAVLNGENGRKHRHDLFGGVETRERMNDDDDDATTLFHIKSSQSCTISNLGIESPRPSPQNTPRPSSTYTLHDEIPTNQPHHESTHNNPQPHSPLLSLLYGLVNSSIILPILMSFGSIIYHDDFFRPYLSTLMKLTVLSGAVHQMTFSSVSSLPFAVGQVQDAGLIFLSAMSRDLVYRLQRRGDGEVPAVVVVVDDGVILATVCVGLSIGTVVLGVALVLVGRWRLASYMQMLPSCVVGGYLAYIGFFCGQAGLALMARENVTGLNEWGNFCNKDAIVRMIPGIIGGTLIYHAVGKFRHMAVLPTCIALLMLIFYAILWITGTTVEEATRNGWINESAESQDWKHTWDFLRLEKVVWSVLPSQIGTLLAMISVVTLSSSLDIAAIEIELKRPLDYNHELTTVGISNIISGMAGGYTGSYIFSQTIFSLRMGIRSRLMGYVIAVVSIIAVVIPFNVLSYIPNAFFGSLLMLICLDLMFEWLIDVRSKMTSAEYTVVIATFGLLQVFGVEFGILAGVVVYFVLKKMGYAVGREENKTSHTPVSS